MSTVYSVRIPKKIREAIDELQGVDWQEELRSFLEQRVKREYLRKELEAAKKLRSEMQTEISSSEIIREDRVAH